MLSRHARKGVRKPRSQPKHDNESNYSDDRKAKDFHSLNLQCFENALPQQRHNDDKPDEQNPIDHVHIGFEGAGNPPLQIVIKPVH
mgnify:FL=1